MLPVGYLRISVQESFCKGKSVGLLDICHIEEQKTGNKEVLSVGQGGERGSESR